MAPRFSARLVLAAVISTSVIAALPAPAAAAATDGQSCAGLQQAISNSSHPAAPLRQFVDQGCEPPPPPPFTAPSACANWETPPLPSWCYPPAPPIAVAGSGSYDSYPVGGGDTHGFTVSNQSNSAFSVTALVVGGADAANFVVGSDQCSGVTLAPGASCALAVAFTPSAARSFAATLAIANTATGEVYDSLTGDGPVSPTFHVSIVKPNAFDWRGFDFLPPSMIGSAPAFGVIDYSYAPNYSYADVTTTDANGLVFHAASSAVVSSDDCPSQVQGGSSYAFSAADAGAHRFLADLGDKPTFTATCTLRVHDPSGAIADATTPAVVAGELCDDTDNNGNGAGDEVFPQVAVTSTAPNGTPNDNPRVAQTVTVGSGDQAQTGTWQCSMDKQRVVPATAGGVVI